jgi:hypothetical protein
MESKREHLQQRLGRRESRTRRGSGRRASTCGRPRGTRPTAQWRRPQIGNGAARYRQPGAGARSRGRTARERARRPGQRHSDPRDKDTQTPPGPEVGTPGRCKETSLIGLDFEGSRRAYESAGERCQGAGEVRGVARENGQAPQWGR